VSPLTLSAEERRALGLSRCSCDPPRSRLLRLGILDETKSNLEYVLALKPADLMERRLQTQVFKLGLAKSIHHARVLIRTRALCKSPSRPRGWRQARARARHIRPGSRSIIAHGDQPLSSTLSSQERSLPHTHTT